MYEARQNKEKVSRRIDGEGMTKQRVKMTDGRITLQKRSVGRGILQRAALILVKSSEIYKDKSRMETLFKATQRLSSKSPICVKIKKRDTVVYLDGDRTTPIGVNDNIDILGHSYVNLPGGLASDAVIDLLNRTFNIPSDWNGNIRIFSCSVASHARFQMNLFSKMREQYQSLDSVQASLKPINYSKDPPVKRGTWIVYKRDGTISAESFLSYNRSIHASLTENQEKKLEEAALKKRIIDAIETNYELLHNLYFSNKDLLKKYFPMLSSKIENFLELGISYDYTFYQNVNKTLKELNEAIARINKIQQIAFTRIGMGSGNIPPITRPYIPLRRRGWR